MDGPFLEVHLHPVKKNTHAASTFQSNKKKSIAGGLSAQKGGICLNLSKLDKILEYHPEDFDVKVQPGITRQSLDQYLKSDGLWFPIDPGKVPSIISRDLLKLLSFLILNSQCVPAW